MRAWKFLNLGHELDSLDKQKDRKYDEVDQLYVLADVNEPKCPFAHIILIIICYVPKNTIET